MSSRVVVTGIGMITAAGKNVEETWKRVLGGDTAIDTITRFDISNFKASLAAEIKDFDPEPFVEEKKDLRFRDLIDDYYTYINEFPNGKYYKQIQRIYESARREIKDKNI